MRMKQSSIHLELTFRRARFDPARTGRPGRARVMAGSAPTDVVVYRLHHAANFTGGDPIRKSRAQSAISLGGTSITPHAHLDSCSRHRSTRNGPCADAAAPRRRPGSAWPESLMSGQLLVSRFMVYTTGSY